MLGNPLDFIAYIGEHRAQFFNLLNQHIQLTAASVLLALAAAIPLAIIASRVVPVARPMTWIAAAGQTVPSLAVLALMLPLLGIGFRPSVAALAIRAFLPIFLNTYVGLRGADPAAVDAARGMGASSAQRLLLVELPLASPIIYAGIQTATVQNVGIATIAAFIGGGGLGELILQGLQMLEPSVLLAGAIPVALLAMTAEVALRYLGRLVVPAGVQMSSN